MHVAAQYIATMCASTRIIASINMSSDPCCPIVGATHILLSSSVLSVTKRIVRVCPFALGNAYRVTSHHLEDDPYFERQGNQQFK